MNFVVWNQYFFHRKMTNEIQDVHSSEEEGMNKKKRVVLYLRIDDK